MNHSVRPLRLRCGRCLCLRLGGGGLAFVGFALCVCLLAPGCERPHDSESGIVFEHQITPQPPRVGTATITMTLADTAGHPVSGAGVNLEGDMSHSGMSPVFGEALESGPGRYRAALEFTMAGDWVVLIHMTLPNGRKVERQFDVKGVQQGAGNVSD